jgi:glycosyltransferase involved in cell wall biosynthesis
LVKTFSSTPAKSSATNVNRNLPVNHAGHFLFENNLTTDVNTTDSESIRIASECSNVFNVGPQNHRVLRNIYAGSDVLVLPSLKTRKFCEPWGLVVNEAFNQGVPVIASDAVGAAAGGLVKHEENGLIVPAGNVEALASAIKRLHDDDKLRASLGENARKSIGSYTHAAWAEGMVSALAAAGVDHSPNLSLTSSIGRS